MADTVTPAASFRSGSRRDGWTASNEGEFLMTLAEGGNASAAVRAAGMSLSAAYARRRDSRRRGFALAWDAALIFAHQRLTDSLFERAIDGEEFVTVRDGGETRYRKPNYRLGLGFLKHLEEKTPGREARWVSRRFDAWLDALACDDNRALRELIAPHEETDPWLRVWARNSFPLVEDSAIFEDDFREEGSPVWHERGRWLTRFPPPDDFDGETLTGTPGQPRYCRTLSSAETAAMDRSTETLDAEIARKDAEALATAAAERDAWFVSLENDPWGEADEPDFGEIEYKSADADRLILPGTGRGTIGRADGGGAPWRFARAAEPHPAGATPPRCGHGCACATGFAGRTAPGSLFDPATPPSPFRRGSALLPLRTASRIGRA